VAFDAPMNRASVAGALSVEPATGFRVAWDQALQVLTILPSEHWRPDTLYRITVGATARSDEGGELGAPLRTVVLTSRAGSGEVAPTLEVERRVRLDTSFEIRLDRPVPIAAVRAALRTEPAVAGVVAATEDPGTFLFTPSRPLAPDTAYRVALDELHDADGVPFATTPAIDVRTIVAPEVVRFRPRSGTGRVDRAANLTVRFSAPMERERTAGSVTVTAGGKRVAGKVTWREDNKVLVFDPTRALPYDASVTVTVSVKARSRTGAPIPKPASETYRVEVKPKPKPPAATAIPTGGGGAVSGNWQAVERYYLRLMNCTRTGGWVTSSGSCSSPGGRDVAPLSLSAGISSKVSRPYAKLLATRNQCSHFIGGGPDDRLRRAGFTSYRWAENIGCRSGRASAAVLGSHLFFQAEKPYNGGHYRNLMNAAYDRAGIGVWVSGGRVRLVVDFYHP